jgi:hypothetical protein
MEKIDLINQTIKKYFAENPSVKITPAKDLMPQFINAGVFKKDDKNGLPIRKVLRDLDKLGQLGSIPFVIAARKLKNTNWYFSPNNGQAIEYQVKETIKLPKVLKTPKAKIPKDQDENYVLNLCDTILKQQGLRHYHFDFLKGDSGTKLPVDIYYPSLSLVIEYRETQHTNAVKHFDKPDVMTVSGVHRGEQRKIYDQRRRDVLPNQGITLVEIGYSDFEFDSSKKILRNSERDKLIITKHLKKHHAL